MKELLIIICILFGYSNTLVAQDYYSLRSFDKPKIILSADFPSGQKGFGFSGYVLNIGKFGIYSGLISTGEQGDSDENEITQWHVISHDEVIGKSSFTIGSTYRIWKPIHVVGSVGLGWTKRQLIYRDTPPIVFESARRVVPEKVKGVYQFGILIAYGRFSYSVLYNSHIKSNIFSLGYSIKVPKY